MENETVREPAAKPLQESDFLHLLKLGTAIFLCLVGIGLVVPLNYIWPDEMAYAFPALSLTLFFASLRITRKGETKEQNPTPPYTPSH